jgi:predicted DNA-binding ribbon-helix-helix protein
MLRPMKREDWRKYGGRVAPRNIYLGARKSSIRLEAVMWDALTDIARDQTKTVDDVILEISRERQDDLSLSAAIRVYIVEYYREALAAAAKKKPRRSGAKFCEE